MLKKLLYFKRLNLKLLFLKNKNDKIRPKFQNGTKIIIEHSKKFVWIFKPLFSFFVITKSYKFFFNDMLGLENDVRNLVKNVINLFYLHFFSYTFYLTFYSESI